MVKASTSFVTTLQAAITAPRPIVTPLENCRAKTDPNVIFDDDGSVRDVSHNFWQPAHDHFNEVGMSMGR